MYEDRDAMISVCDSQEFVPYGRQYMAVHPGKAPAHAQGAADTTDHGLPIVKALRDFSISSNVKRDSWQLRRVPESSEGGEEELYIHENTVVWSRGSAEGAGQVVKSYTMDSHIQEALWCSFLLPVDEPHSAEILAHKQTGVAIIESNNVSVLTTEGKDYITAIPFTLAKTWSIQGGLLFERSTVEKSSAPSTTPQKKERNKKLPVLFSMLHPLDDIAPVICKTGGSTGSGKVSYVTETTHQIVFTADSPCLVMTYDRALSAHSLWTIRRAKPEEVFSVCNTSGDALGSSGFPTDYDPVISVTPGVTSKSTSVHFSSRLTTSSQSPSLSSPFRSMQSKSNTPSQLPSRLNSPSLSHLAALSRTQSPLASSSMGRLHMSSPVAAKASPAAGRTPLSFANSNMTSYLDSTIRPQEGLEPIPELCLDHLWTETASTRDGIAGIAKKVFMTTDLCGQRYVCYLVPFRNQLRLVKCEESNDKSQLIVGALSTLSVRDAVPLPALSMILLLDMTSNLVLHSGLVKINKVHMWSLPSPAHPTPSQTPQDRRSPVRFPNLPGFWGGGGGPITSSRPPSALDARFDMDDDMAMLSPVPTEFNDSSQMLDTSVTEELSFQQPSHPATMITALKDPVANRFTVELTNGALFRASLALDSNAPLIKLSLEAMKQMLPREASLHVLTRWYSSYNTPGSLNGQSEWTRFSKCLLALMGYDITQLKLTTKKYSENSNPNTPKKSRPSDQGSEEDWIYVLDSDYHRMFASSQGHVIGLDQEDNGGAEPITSVGIDNKAALFQQIPSVLWALHLVYEELKLHSLIGDELELLAQLLHQLATDLNCTLYMDHYARDWPDLFSQSNQKSAISQEYLQQMNRPSFFTMTPPQTYEWLYRFMKGLPVAAYPYLPGVNELTKYSIAMFVIMFAAGDPAQITWSDHLRKVCRAGQRLPDFEESITSLLKNIPADSNLFERVVLYVTNMGKLADFLVGGVSLAIKEAVNHCRESPPTGWPQAAYTVIGRQDLAQQKEKNADWSHSSHVSAQSMKSGGDKEEEDGMEHLDHQLLELRFPNDLRVNEVRRLLQSAKPVRVHVVQRPEVNDHAFVEEQERALYALCVRTMALPVGRGMFTLCTYRPVPTHALPVPRLCLTGRAPPRNTTVDLTHIDTPANMNHWPLFHNGVAAGLRIAHTSQLDSTWILYNKPKSSELTNEHAGFLMGLGLSGHLSGLATLNVHDYLCRGHEMTSVGLILGISAGKRGTMDMTTTKLLSIHVAALLPPTSTELDMPHNVEVAAILGVGLVYQGTAHRHIAQVLLNEIGRPPGPEMENCSDRESYSLAAGLGLGMVMLGKGQESAGLADLNMADQLFHYMVGGHKRPLSGARKERYRAASYQIMEGDGVNTDVTAPGAILALGMMFFDTHSSAVAEWLTAPDTQFLLDFVRPDLLLLRTVSRGLVMWGEIHPSADWVNSNLPELVSKYAFNKQQYAGAEAEADVDWETMSQAYCYIVAGACMALGLKFAGSANSEAFQCLHGMAEQMLRLMNKALVEQAGKSSVENCVLVILLSLAMVMSGTGNLEVLRLCRHLRGRVGPSNNHVLYGSHMAVSMAIGLLFLGGGRYTLSTEPQAIAAMLCAFFPKFPIHSNDNRYHLQAFRHLHVLAAQPRVLVPRDVTSGKLCYVPLEIVFKGNECYEEMSFDAMAPCLLPQLSLLKQVRVKGPRYWPVSFDVSTNWQVLKDVLGASGYLHVKQRAGHLSYLVDPQGYHSVLSQSLSTEHALGKVIRADDIQSFSSDPNILAFAEYFCAYTSHKEFGMTQFLSKVLYECVSHEKLQVLPLYVTMQQLMSLVAHKPRSIQLQEIRFIMALYERLSEGGHTHLLLHTQFFLHLQSAMDTHLSAWLQTPESKRCLRQYLSEEAVTSEDCYLPLATYLSWLHIPHASVLLLHGVTEDTNFADLYMKLSTLGMTVPGIMSLNNLLQTLKTSS